MKEISNKTKKVLEQINSKFKGNEGKDGFYMVYRETEKLLSELLFERTETHKEYTVAMIPKTLQLYHNLISRKYRYNEGCGVERCFDGWVWASDATIIKSMYWCDPSKKDLRNEKKNFKKCMDALVELGFVHRKIVMVDYSDCYYYYPLYEQATEIINEEMGHRYRNQEAIDNMKQENKERASKKNQVEEVKVDETDKTKEVELKTEKAPEQVPPKPIEPIETTSEQTLLDVIDFGELLLTDDDIDIDKGVYELEHGII